MSTRVLILGAGGHGQVVSDILLRAREAGSDLEPVGFLDDDFALHGRKILGLSVLGAIGHLPAIEHDAVIVAIGGNRARARIFERLASFRQTFANAVHPGAVLAPDVQLGAGVVVCAGVIVNTGALIADNVILNTGCTIDHHDRIGAHTHVAPGVHLGGNVSIGKGALLGIGCAVIPGRVVGDWAVVGAGASVIRDIPSHATAVGVPARVVRQRPAASGGCHPCR